VSAIIPNYNKEKTLHACLSAIYAQTRPPAEVIVVDDASTDRSREIAARFPCTVVAFAANRGVSAARNAGAAAADGDVLFFVDSDIALAPDAVAGALAVLSEHPDCGVAQGIYDIRPLFADGPVEEYKTLCEHFWRRRDAGVASATLFALTAVRRAAFDAVGGFDETLRDAEDIEWGTRLPASYEIRMDAGIVGRHDDVDRFWPYLGEQLRRARVYAGTVVARRLRRRTGPGSGHPTAHPDRAGHPDGVPVGGGGRGSRGADVGSVVAMAASALAVVSLPLAAVSGWLAAVPVGLLVATGLADRELLLFVARHKGPGFVAFFAAMHLLTHVTEFAGMAVGVLGGVLARPPAGAVRPAPVRRSYQ
jgi:hypothetical protein